MRTTSRQQAVGSGRFARAGKGLRHALVVAATCACLLPTDLRAQQDPVYAMHMWNLLAVNPGYAGSSDQLNASLLARRQWVGLEGAPSTQALTIHAPLRSERLALGLSTVRDQTGPLDNMRLNGDIAYHLRINRNTRLSLGLKAGLEWMQMRLTQVPNVDPADPIFQQDQRSAARPNFGFGAYWWGSKGYIGVSVPKLMEYNAIELDAGGQQLTGAQQRRHYYIMAGRVFGKGTGLELHAWAMAKAVEAAPISMDLALGVLVKEQLWAGVTYRHPSAVAPFVAYRFQERFKLGYAYEVMLGSLGVPQNGTHEIMLNYELRLRREKTLSPRFF